MNVKAGDTASVSKEVTDQVIRAFAEVSGDHNPLHLNDEFAATTRFGRRIAHGMLGASLISSLLGNTLPGPGSIYLSQSLKFRGPAFIGDRLTARVTVSSIREGRPILILETVCENQNGEVLIEGEAVVMLEG
ncbi:MAG: MaoC family dehydratase [Pyrinomonadaceae bacterium]